jgi:hypothetical protein
MLLSIVAVPPASAQSERAVRIVGVVKAADGSPLQGVTVSIEGTSVRTTTDDKGSYELSFRNSVSVVTVVGQLPNYRSASEAVDVSGGFRIVNFTLKPAFASAVTVRAEVPMLKATDGVSRISLAPEQIAVLPSLGEKDIFRAFQLLPGVASSETSSGLFVRGGRPDQTLVEYDSFRVYQVDHLFGYFSAFNMDAVERVELSKGGFEAKHGGTLSSVMEIAGKSGSLEKPGFSVGASLLSANGVVETPLFGHKGSALVAFRQSYQSPLYNRILDLFDNGSPRRPAAIIGGGGSAPQFAGGSFDSQPSSKFYDVNGKFLLKPSGKDTLSATVYQGHDDVDNSRSLSLPENLPEGVDVNLPSTLDIDDVRRSGNTGAGLLWSHQWNTDVQSRFSIGYSRFSDVRDRTAQGGGSSTPSSENNRLQDVTMKASVPITFAPGHTLESGIELTSTDSTYSFQNGRVVVPGETNTGLTTVLDESRQGKLTSFYAQESSLFGSKLLIVPGVRVTRYDRTSRQYTDPRVAASLFLSDRFKLKAAGGRYHQFANRVTREDVLQGNRAFWTIADGDLVPVSSSTQLIGGGSYDRGSLLVDVEVFSKNLSHLTQFAPRLAQPSATAIDYRDYFYHGDGTARGAEFLVQKKSGRHTGWVSYTLSKVEETFPELQSDPFPADHDQRHELKLVDVMRLGLWTLSGTFIFSTGKPFTELENVETVALTPDISIDRVVVGSKNGARLPAYHRMDVAVTRDIRFSEGKHRGTFGVTLFNLYNRKNIWYKEFNVLQGEISENNIRLMGITLNVSFGLKF